jgi:cysteine-rich repeat protein
MTPVSHPDIVSLVPSSFFAGVGRRTRRSIRRCTRACTRRAIPIVASILAAFSTGVGIARAASPCDGATHPNQCGWFDSGTLPPFVQDAILAKNGVVGAGNVLVLSSGDPADPDNEISNDVSQNGCGTNPDGWETYDCVLLDSFVPPQDSVILALSSEWFEWYQTIFTDWMTIAGAGIPTVDVSINSWIDNKVDVLPYGPWETGVVILTSLSASKMVNFRVADSGDHIYDTAIVVVPASWFSAVDGSNSDPTLLCGDGVLEPGEECDDGNHVSDDGCSTLCLGTQPPPSAPPPVATCGNLLYAFPNGTTAPYTCGADTCAGFRCVVGNTISAACYNADQCAAACAGSCVDVQTAQLDCSTMCSVQPPANEPPPVLPETCETLVYAWPDGSTMPYTCDDDCHGQRCVTAPTVDPTCYKGDECDGTTCPNGVCVDTPADDCATFCAAATLPADCSPAEEGQTRLATNQHGPCSGNVEVCTSGQWRVDDNAFRPEDEACNGVDDDCNGVADDMFQTCGDPGLCQNTINTCDLANPSVPVVCTTLSPPSPVEICNNGLDDDCEGSPDDGCECGDEECMPGESFQNCAADCLPPANGAPCEDGDLCTSGDQWQNGSCASGAPVVCESDNACVTSGSCNPATGCSATKVVCDDAVACTEDVCDAATGCVNTPVDLACDDADPCTTDICDGETGCAHLAEPSCAGQDADGDGFIGAGDGGTDCDDGNAAVYPGAAELCNGLDDDCNVSEDDGFDLGAACQSAANDCGSTVSGTTVCSADGLGVECAAVAPPNPAGYGDPCQSAANNCGATAAGSVGCDATCSAVVPANPSGYGDTCQSAANVCGDTAAGTIVCDGTCNASEPVAIDTDLDGSPDCIDGCPADTAKTSPGVCGCGSADTDTNNNGVIDCQETQRADLAAGVIQRTATPMGGKRVRYQLVAKNLGPDTATPAITLSASVTGSVSELILPKACTGTVAGITCISGPLNSGRSKAFAIRVIPAAGTMVTVTAAVSSAVLDPDAANQTASVTTLVP